MTVTNPAAHPALAAGETLALYYSPGCPYCVWVLRTLERLGVQVELRDTWRNAEHRADLVRARRRGTVPVLRRTTADEDVWMPESRDIMRYLEQRFG